MKIKNLKLKIFILTTYCLLLTTTVYAEVKIGDEFGFRGPEYSSLGAATSQLVAPIFSIAAFLVIIYFLMGAFKYLKSGGNKEEVEGARQMITHAIIGFMILIFAFFVLQFLLSNLFDIQGFFKIG